jgi:hypothetical protein
MLVSTARWIRHTGGSGLVVNLDLRALAATHRRDVPEGEIYYTPAALWDAYEVLRQFIDATDEMEGLLVVVSAPEALLDDVSNRSLQKYRALRNRIWDDVRDRSYADPYAPMVRLAALQGGAALTSGSPPAEPSRRCAPASPIGTPSAPWAARLTKSSAPLTRDSRSCATASPTTGSRAAC